MATMKVKSKAGMQDLDSVQRQQNLWIPTDRLSKL